MSKNQTLSFVKQSNSNVNGVIPFDREMFDRWLKDDLHLFFQTNGHLPEAECNEAISETKKDIFNISSKILEGINEFKLRVLKTAALFASRRLLKERRRLLKEGRIQLAKLEDDQLPIDAINMEELWGDSFEETNLFRKFLDAFNQLKEDESSILLLIANNHPVDKVSHLYSIRPEQTIEIYKEARKKIIKLLNSNI